MDAAREVKETLERVASNVEIVFERLAVTKQQIYELGLPTRPTKTKDSRAKNFGPISAELDAISPDVLRALVEMRLDTHMPSGVLCQVWEEEEMERQQLELMIDAAFDPADYGR